MIEDRADNVRTGAFHLLDRCLGRIEMCVPWQKDQYHTIHFGLQDLRIGQHGGWTVDDHDVRHPA
jgi:hypothetical protein